jgi:hypothetical protein
VPAPARSFLREGNSRSKRARVRPRTPRVRKPGIEPANGPALARKSTTSFGRTSSYFFFAASPLRLPHFSR